DHSLDINSINLDDELKIKEAIGLSASRQWYLYDQIRDLVQNPNKRNNICPKPS
ncbi:1094_t:CDS:1, partial [Entrophospora sp. SA101]